LRGLVQDLVRRRELPCEGWELVFPGGKSEGACSKFASARD